MEFTFYMERCYSTLGPLEPINGDGWLAEKIEYDSASTSTQCNMFFPTH